MEVGSLLAAIAAHKDISGPWKEVIRWYQQKEDIRVKFEQVVVQFEPDELIDDQLVLKTDITQQNVGDIVVDKLTVEEDSFQYIR